MPQVVEVMHGKGLLGKILFLSLLLLLGACQDNGKSQVSDKPVVSSISKEFQLKKPDFSPIVKSSATNCSSDLVAMF